MPAINQYHGGIDNIQLTERETVQQPARLGGPIIQHQNASGGWTTGMQV
jgi:starvation-inducible outer membrane lipoprotein